VYQPWPKKKGLEHEATFWRPFRSPKRFRRRERLISWLRRKQCPKLSIQTVASLNGAAEPERFAKARPWATSLAAPVIRSCASKPARRTTPQAWRSRSGLPPRSIGLDQAQRNAKRRCVGSPQNRRKVHWGTSGDLPAGVSGLWAVQSANASNSASDRQAINSEVTQLTAETRPCVANTAEFNGLKLLDGSFGSATIPGRRECQPRPSRRRRANFRTNQYGNYPYRRAGPPTANESAGRFDGGQHGPTPLLPNAGPRPAVFVGGNHHDQTVPAGQCHHYRSRRQQVRKTVAAARSMAQKTGQYRA